MKYYCNPVNIPYKYQFNRQQDGGIVASREAADPSLVYFKGKYLLFPSMTCGFLYSDDLVNWNFHPLKNMPVYDYAPDVCVAGKYLYFCASNHEHGTFYKTEDPFSDNYEKLDTNFTFWDPDMFADDDGRLYFYWGSSFEEPIYGVELDPETMLPVGERKALAKMNPEKEGWTRTGEDHVPERSDEEKAQILQNVGENFPAAARAFILGLPYAEGPWMTKHENKYYLQVATSGSRFNIYNDIVYVSDSPLGPFEPAKNNPYSYKPGGFLPGAGHGSTMTDVNNNTWHVATSRISLNHNFERRISLWPAGWDADGEMFCNQRYGDWILPMPKENADPWQEPEWMLLSYKKPVSVSSAAEDHAGCLAVDEDIRTWWSAETANPGEWICIDLETIKMVYGIQINFADDNLIPELPKGAELTGALMQERWIDETSQVTQWKLEGSMDGENWFVLEDKTEAVTDLSHDVVIIEEGVTARYIRLTVNKLPYNQKAHVSGLRVFGIGAGNLPAKVSALSAIRKSPVDIEVSWDKSSKHPSAVGHVILWGFEKEKLYHSYMTFKDREIIGGLAADQPVYIRVDSFNEAGITHGDVFRVV